MLPKAVALGRSWGPDDGPGAEYAHLTGHV